MARARSLKFDVYTFYLGSLSLILLIRQVENSMLFAILYSLIIHFALINTESTIRKKILSYTVKSLFFLAVLAIVQFIIMALLGLDVAKDLAFFNGMYSSASDSVGFFDLSAYGTNEYPYLRLLGHTDVKILEFGPISFFNVRSFIHEPSLSPAIFFMPAVVGLIAKSTSKTVVWTIIIFCVLTYSWSVFLVLAMTPIFYLLLKKRNFALIVFFFVVIFMTCIYILIPPDFGYQMDQLGDIKSESNILRLSSISAGLHAGIASLFGNSTLIRMPIGMLAYSLYYGGLILMFVYCLLLFYILRFSSMAVEFDLNQRVGISLLVSYTFLATVINEYGFLSPLSLVTFGQAYHYISTAYQKRLADSSTNCNTV